MNRITESESPYRHLEKMTVEEITAHVNHEDHKVAPAISKALPQVNTLINAAIKQLENGGRLFYLGAGSGGRLSVLDVIELPTTYGVEKGLFNVILAGGTDRLTDALEEKEDDTAEGWEKLTAHQISQNDIVLGISASGTTPFVLEGLKQCKRHGIPTGCIVSNPDSPIAAQADYPVEVITGPELISGSTRMKCGTAQKMLFDMISTTIMIRLGRVDDNRMVNVALINNKIIDRAVKMLMDKSGIDNYAHAKKLLMEYGSVKKAMDHLTNIIAK